MNIHTDPRVDIFLKKLNEEVRKIDPSYEAFRLPGHEPNNLSIKCHSETHGEENYTIYNTHQGLRFTRVFPMGM
jgi:hypothetical protein